MNTMKQNEYSNKIIKVMGDKGQFLVDWAEENRIELDDVIVNAFMLGQEWTLNLFSEKREPNLNQPIIL